MNAFGLSDPKEDFVMKKGSKCLVVATVAAGFLLAALSASAATFRIGHHRAVMGSVTVVAYKMGYFDQTIGKGKYTVKQFPQGKLMRQAILNFVNSLSKPCAHRTHNVVWVWHTSQVLSNTHCHTVVHTQAHSYQKIMPTLKVSLCWRASLADLAA